MIYLIKPENINKVVGATASIRMVETYHPAPECSFINLRLNGKLEFIPDLDGIEILPRAKPMDIITSVPIMHSGKLFSKRLFDLISRFKLPECLQVFEAKAYHKGETHDYCYFYIYEAQENEIIDWELSNFIKTTSFGLKTIGNSFKIDPLEYRKKRDSEGLERYKALKLFVKSEALKYDIFRMSFSVRGYFISERLKQAIETSDMKGVEMVPIDQLGFEVEFV